VPGTCLCTRHARVAAMPPPRQKCFVKDNADGRRLRGCGAGERTGLGQLAGSSRGGYLLHLSLCGACVTRSSEPVFNIPPVVLAILAVCVLVYAGEALLLTEREDFEFVYFFGFVPARYDPDLWGANLFPGGIGATIWTFLTYAFLHGSTLHLGMNAIWFLPFGSAVARRFGSMRFIAFFLVTAAAGAVAHLVTHFRETLPMIGASAAISGMMAGAIRFAFQHGGPLTIFRTDEAGYHVPAAPLAVALRDTRVVIFLVAWFGSNLLFGIGSVNLPGVEETIAWQAHIGGFMAGLLLFSLFDPVKQALLDPSAPQFPPPDDPLPDVAPHDPPPSHLPPRDHQSGE
jgi:membrane associated rhomboid family serine protease